MAERQELEEWATSLISREEGELVPTACGCYTPRPADWPEEGTALTGTALTVQMRLDELARKLGTPWWEAVVIPGLGRIRKPLLFCPDCAERKRRQFQQQRRQPALTD